METEIKVMSDFEKQCLADAVFIRRLAENSHLDMSRKINIAQSSRFSYAPKQSEEFFNACYAIMTVLSELLTALSLSKQKE